ncbi:MAG: tetratricopeptide repeat protein [Alistipes sp.]|jgi:tetratricopeptide (TPR) repeat protein|nr:tetratricopeptide repeat protein [Alistipes sp.]
MKPRHILLALALPSVATVAVAQQDVTAQQNVSASQNPIALDSLAVVYYTDGVRLAAEERYGEALSRFEKALEVDPDHAPSMYGAAGVLARPGGDLEEGLGYSSRAVELDPANRWYKRQKGLLLRFGGRTDEAIALYEEMTRDAERFDIENFGALASLYYQKGRTDDALAVLDSAAMHTGKNPAILEARRGILMDAGRFDEAVEETEKYVAATPFDEINRLALAEMYAYGRRDSLAVETLKEVVAINPDNAAALDRLAGLYRDRGDTRLFFSTLRQLFLLDGVTLEEKIGRFESLAQNTPLYRRHFLEMGDLALALVTCHPGRDEVLELYSGHLMRTGDVEGALGLLKTRLDGERPPLSAFMRVIEVEAWLRRPDSVVVYSDRALAAYPDQTQVYLFRANVEQYLGRMEDARKTLDRALKSADTDSLRSEIHGAVGSLWHEEGDDRKAFKAYDKALRYDPDNAMVLNNYAYYLAEADRELSRALGMALRAVNLRENDATLLDTYAWVLYKTGDFAEAKKIMQRALPLDEDGGSAELLIHYGDILWALGEDFMATVYWKRARDAGYEPAAEIEERLSRTK